MRESSELTFSESSVPVAPVLSERGAQVVFWVSLVAGTLWTLYLLWHSPGTFTDDEIGHFIIARNAWHSPSLILSEWGRAVNTLIYMIPALFSLTAARVTATLMSALTVLFAAKLARKLGAKYYFAIPIVVWFQLWFCDYGHAAIVEIPFSLLMVLAAYFFVSDEFLAVSVVVGILPYVRDEAIAFALLWAVYCIWKKRWGAAIIALLPAALINVLSQLVLGVSQVGMYFNLHPIGNQQAKVYGIGAWSYYPKVLISDVGLPVLALAVYSLGAILKDSRRLLVFMFYGSYLAIHMTLYHLGLFAVGGVDRYVFPLAPAIGVAAVFGLEYIVAVCRSAVTHILRLDRKWLKPAIVAIVLGFVIIDGMRYTVRPPDPEAVAAKMTTDWLRREKLADHPILSTDVWFDYYMRLRLQRTLWVLDPKAASVAKPGTVAVWDKHFSDTYGLPLASLSPAKDWERLHEFDAPATKFWGKARFIVFEKRSPKLFGSRRHVAEPAGGKQPAGRKAGHLGQPSSFHGGHVTAHHSS